MKVIGIGNTAEVLDQGDGKACKLFYEGYPYNSVEFEYNNAKIMQTMDIPVPKVYELVKVEGRAGIIYEKLEGQSVLEKLLQDGDVNSLVDKMVNLHKEILEHHTCEVMPYKEFLKSCIGKKTKLNADMYNEIESLPEGDYLCHGDYHPGNVWIDANERVLTIDFMNVCCGPWQYDVARTYILISEGEVSQELPEREKILHMKKQISDMYLNKFHVSYNEISEYVSIIRECRKHEMA